MIYTRFLIFVSGFSLLLTYQVCALTISDLFCDNIRGRYPKIEDMKSHLNPIPKFCKNKDDSSLSCVLGKQRFEDANKCYSATIQPREDIKQKGLCAQVKERFPKVEDMQKTLDPIPKWCTDDKDARISCLLAKQRLENATKCYVDDKDEASAFCEEARRRFHSPEQVAKEFDSIFKDTCMTKIDQKTRENCDILLKLIKDTLECVGEK